MCGRYNLELTDRFPRRFQISNKLPPIKSRYNIAPSQDLPVIVGDYNVEIMKWGLIPFWSKDGKGGIINARAESVAVKPMFKKPLQLQRCLVPATGFYEWKKTNEGKIPFHIRLKTHDYFSFAGIYDKGTYAIITTTPNEIMTSIHSRMPVILKEENEDEWLDPDITEIEKLIPILVPYPSSEIEAYPISNRINSPFNDDPSVIK